MYGLCESREREYLSNIGIVDIRIVGLGIEYECGSRLSIAVIHRHWRIIHTIHTQCCRDWISKVTKLIIGSIQERICSTEIRIRRIGCGA